MMYLLIPEEHAQIVDALTQWTTPNWAGSGVDQCNAALSMLKAMKQVTPSAYITETEQGPMVWTLDMYDEACTYCDDEESPVPLYAKEQQ